MDGERNLSLDVAIGSMRMLANMGRDGFLDGIGVSKLDFDRFIGDSQWINTDRNRMSSVLHALVNSSVDALGLPRFDLPAEYIAAAIALFVHPVNIMPACVYGPPSKSAEDAANLAVCQPCTPAQLFALVKQLYADSSRHAARALFEKKTSIALDKVLSSQTAKNGGAVK